MIGIQLGMVCEIWLGITLAIFAWVVSPLPSDKPRQVRRQLEAPHET
jgi:hypothetical protein